MLGSFDYGDLVRCTGTYTDSAGTALDPTVVGMQYKNPSGTVTSLVYLTDAALVRSSTGIYYVDINANATGKWRVRWYSTGTGQAAEQEEFYVEASHF